MTGHPLPAPLERALDRLSHEGWRERKEAVETLLAGVGAIAEASVREALAHRLLDGLLTPDAVEGRGACHEALVRLGSPCVPLVLERLDGRTPGARLLVDVLGQIGGPDQVPLLAQLAGGEGEDTNLRASAATALGAIGGTGAIEALERLLTAPSAMLRTYAVDALRTAGAAVDVGRLAPLLGDPVTRRGAAALLGNTNSLDALPYLVTVLGDKMAGVRAVAAVSLVDLEAALVHQGKARLATDAIAAAGVDVRDRVRELIGHGDTGVQAAAIRLCGIMGIAEALADVLGVMDDPVLLEAGLALVASLGPAANVALAEAASGVETGHRQHLYRLAGALVVDVVHPALAALLVEGLGDPSESAACAAAEALRFAGGRSSMGALYRAMGRDGSLGELAGDALAEIAGRLGNSRHDDLMLIVGPSWPQDGALARNLCRVFGRLAALDYVPHLVNMLGATDVEVRVAAAGALGHIRGEHEGRAALTFALADEEPSVRSAACRSLGLLGSSQSCESLISATSDPFAPVRTAAVQALVVIGNPIALPRLREIIAEDPVATVIVHAIEGLGLSTSDQDMLMLMSLCTSADHEVVKAAARALEGFPAHRATAALLGLLSHDRWDVRSAAAEAIAGRGDVTALDPVRSALDGERDELVRHELTVAAQRLRDLAGEGRE